MQVYLASPNTQQQAEHVSGMPVLLSYAIWTPWMERYQQTFGSVLIDSGAFSELTGAAKVDIDEYREWSRPWLRYAEAIAGLDDISGDWKRSLENYGAIPWSFPTIHDTDPPELLRDLIAVARKRSEWLLANEPDAHAKPWLGIGLKPPRQGKERFIRWVCDNVPEDFHIHGWALRAYTHIRRLDSVDSTNWWRDAMALRKDLPWLTYGECLEIIVKRYIRWQRVIAADSEQLSMWEVAS
jgi:hypothetical protein